VTDDTCCCAAVTLAAAAVTATCSEELSIVASTAPLATLAPTTALTLRTVPGTGNNRSARCAGSMVPAALTVCWTVPVDARTRVYPGVVGDPDRVSAQAPVPPPTIRTAPATAATRHPVLLSATSLPSWVHGQARLRRCRAAGRACPIAG